MNVADLVITIVLGYFIGAIPFAVIIAKAKGVDIFSQGSGNPGATNVKRAVGKWAGNLCFALDALKGFAAAYIPQMTSWENAGTLMVFGLLAAIAGHSFSVFIRFRGGKGVATAIGGLLAVMPWVLLVGLVLWLVVFYVSRYVSLASIAFGVSLPISAALMGFLPEGYRMTQAQVILAAVLAVIIVVRHRSNIVRLLKGEESRFERKKKGA